MDADDVEAARVQSIPLAKPPRREGRSRRDPWQPAQPARAFGTTRSRVLLLGGASFACVDVLLDVLLLVRYGREGRWHYFAVSLTAICVASLFTWLASLMDFGLVRGSRYGNPNGRMPAWLRGSRVFAVLPGVNIVLHALECLITGEKQGAYVYARLIEAAFEAAPQALLQTYVALGSAAAAPALDEGDDGGGGGGGGMRSAGSGLLLGLSLCSSLLTIAWALVDFELDQAQLRGPNAGPCGRGPVCTYVAWLYAARLGEVSCRALSLALLGAAAGGWWIVGMLGAEWGVWAAWFYAHARARNEPRCQSAFTAALATPAFLLARLAPLSPATGVDGTCAPTDLPFRAYAPVRVLTVALVPLVLVELHGRSRVQLDSAVVRACLLGSAAGLALWLLALPPALHRAAEFARASGRPQQRPAERPFGHSCMARRREVPPRAPASPPAGEDAGSDARSDDDSEAGAQRPAQPPAVELRHQPQPAPAVAPAAVESRASRPSPAPAAEPPPPRPKAKPPAGAPPARQSGDGVPPARRVPLLRWPSKKGAKGKRAAAASGRGTRIRNSDSRGAAAPLV